ncbi:4,5-DOPA dioxygenase extradiol [soil metagenome]
MTDLMPAAFLGHGNPMNALESNHHTDAWAGLGATLPRPRAVVVVSAHWFTNHSAVTAMGHPRTIHDFYGFPDALFSVSYPAPGAPDVAEELAEVVKPTWVGQDLDSWGLDHGAWSVLVHLFPDADIPVVQLSIDAGKIYDEHLALGAALAPLRERGIFVLGSGNVVHNLGRIDPSRPDSGFGWARDFDDAAREVMTGSPGEAPGPADHRDHALAVPTPDHFLPLLYLAGLADAAGEGTDVLVDGYAMGSLSMTAYTLGADPVATNGGGPQPPLPDPDLIPPEGTNT